MTEHIRKLYGNDNQITFSNPPSFCDSFHKKLSSRYRQNLLPCVTPLNSKQNTQTGMCKEGAQL